MHCSLYGSHLTFPVIPMFTDDFSSVFKYINENDFQVDPSDLTKQRQVQQSHKLTRRSNQFFDQICP